MTVKSSIKAFIYQYRDQFKVEGFCSVQHHGVEGKLANGMALLMPTSWCKIFNRIIRIFCYRKYNNKHTILAVPLPLYPVSNLLGSADEWFRFTG